jgi:integrase
LRYGRLTGSQRMTKRSISMQTFVFGSSMMFPRLTALFGRLQRNIASCTASAANGIKAATSPQGIWYRNICYNFMLIMCNTGMRPPEARNLPWRDIMAAKDRDGREIVVLSEQGKGKSRKLVAPKSVGDYLDRVRKLSKATKPDDPVFTIINGKPAKYLYRKTWRRATSERQQSWTILTVRF